MEKMKSVEPTNKSGIGAHMELGQHLQGGPYQKKPIRKTEDTVAGQVESLVQYSISTNDTFKAYNITGAPPATASHR